MDIKTIQDRITEAADKELWDEIEGAAKSLDSMLRTGYAHKVVITDRDEKTVIAEAEWFRALYALKKAAFDLQRDNRRERRTAEFVAKVDRLDSDMEQIRQMARDRE